MKVNKKHLVEMANTIYKRAETETISQAFKAAWKAFKLQAAMLSGEAEFSYRKVNGEMRHARGTLLYVEDAANINSGKRDIMRYYDVEKKGFRTFVVVNLQ